jgi:hypothetical protein
LLIEEKATAAMQDALRAAEEAWEREQIRELEPSRPLRRRVAEALINLGRRIDPDVDEASISSEVAA